MPTLSAFGNSITYSPERGGIVTSLRFQEHELLYLDEATFRNLETNVRGGIPILFPNAGAIDSSHFPNLKQHGYARLHSDWKVEQASTPNSFSETLTSSAKTQAVYPYQNRLRFSGVIENAHSVCFIQTVENLEATQAIPIAMGLHPYFKVPHAQKQTIRFECLGSDLIQTGFAIWSNGGTTSFANPKLLDPAATIRVTLPELGTLILEPSVEYERIWIWSLPEKDFICIEPVLRDVGGLIDDPYLLEPGKRVSATFYIRKESV